MKSYLVGQEGSLAGQYWELRPGEKVVLGRSAENKVRLDAEPKASRRHAEITVKPNGWEIRDLRSRNGTRVNGERIQSVTRLSTEDSIQIGNSIFVVSRELPGAAARETPDFLDEAEAEVAEEAALRITTLSKSRYLDDSESKLLGRKDETRNLSKLFRLGVEMGRAGSEQQLAETLLDGLLECTHANTGAVLHSTASSDFRILAHQGPDTYSKVSESISSTVLRTQKGLLAQDVQSDKAWAKRASIEEIGVESIICAPILQENRVSGLIHLYSTDPTRALDKEDLEFTLAVAEPFSRTLSQLKERTQLHRKIVRLRENLETEFELVGTSESIEAVKRQIELVAPQTTTVLVRGESGVGKELVARAIHLNSQRKDGPIVCLNCAALTETLLESELFGHEKGSFTGATEQKIGKFEAAHTGTIFLDEIGEMNPGTQAKLLRILEGQPFERVGGSKPITVDVRVVAATNVELENAIQEGKFRSDLYFRLQVVPISVPPLRERRQDIIILAQHFLEKLRHQVGRKITGFAEEAIQKLKTYDWPGNVRELKNAVERAVVLGTDDIIQAADIQLSNLRNASSGSAEYRPLSLDQLEQEHISRTLAHTNWNKSQAATILGIERSTLDRKINKFGLSKN